MHTGDEESQKLCKVIRSAPNRVYKELKSFTHVLFDALVGHTETSLRVPPRKHDLYKVRFLWRTGPVVLQDCVV